ncbi:MAG: hypothetical protein IPO85_06300 [Saprospiraceae bacterium]|uniref:Uncharacterized protein n=1 Tax=Candidatus Defluviibacterium haderslevense TaxID=2981993 RepID=A0A9D7S8J6_9BACT|nr:hypothetical protein [Candidatus Defluviibacterium haderslevense]
MTYTRLIAHTTRLLRFFRLMLISIYNLKDGVIHSIQFKQRRYATSFALASVFLLIQSGLNPLTAGIVFDGTLGINAPPATIGGYQMTPFPLDDRPLFNLEIDVIAPSVCPKTIDFSIAGDHRRIGNGWATWSHGYAGDIYFINDQTITIALPTKTNAFYCYVEPNNFAVYTVEALANDGTSSGLINVDGAGGATGFAFYTLGNCNLTSITITVDAGANGFGLGEFGINLDTDNGALSCKNVNISLDQNCEAFITPQMLLTGPYNCYEAFDVSLSHYGKLIPNPIDSHYLGDQIIATVLDRISGNSCWSYLKIEDKLAPEIICRDEIVSCLQFEHQINPAVSEDCSRYTVQLLDEIVEKIECDELYIKEVIRKWVSTDAQGNVSDTCSQSILVRRPDIDAVVYPEQNIILYCQEIIREDENGNPHPYVTGIPTLEGDSIWPSVNFVCNLYVDYTDQDLGEIACTHKIMRTWRVREWWCNQELIRTFQQFIQIKDVEGPIITHAPYDFHATTSHKSCYADIELPPVDAYDACHKVLRTDVEYPGGILVNKNGGRVLLPVGVDTIVYRIYDNCYNVTIDTLLVTVKDETEPVAICEDAQ